MKNTVTKEELDLYLERLDLALKRDIEEIKNFDESDILQLEKAMLMNLRNLKKYDAMTLKIGRKLDLMCEKEERLSSQVNYTKSGVISNLNYEIKKSIAVIVVYAMISSNNVNEFLKRLIILLLIDVFTFKINLEYFTSNGRKELVKKRLEKLRKRIFDEKINYCLYDGINKSFALKLDVQYDKLLELYPEIEEEKIKTRRRK